MPDGGLEPVIARFLADTSQLVAPIQAAVDEVQASEERMAEAAEAAASSMAAADERMAAGFEATASAARAAGEAVDGTYAGMGTSADAAGGGSAAGGTGGAEAAAAASEVEAANKAVIDSAAEVAAAADEAALQWRAAYAEMAASTIALSDDMDAAAVKMDAAWADMGAAEAAYDAESATTLGLTKTQLLGLTAAAGVVAVATVKMAADFQTSTTRLVTSAGESAGALGQVQQGILSMAGEVGDTASQLSAGMYTVESAGYHGAAGLTVLRAAAQGAKDEGADLTTVADAVSTALTDYHLPASAAATVTSQLVTAVGQGKTTMQLFADSLHSVTPLAAAAHISLADVTGTLAEMTDHGMSADQASQNLAMTLRTLLSPTQSMRAELAQLGMTSTTLSDDLSSKGLQGTLEALSQAILQRMGPSGKLMLDAFNSSKTAAANFAEAIEKAPAPVQKLGQQLASGAITVGDYQKTIKGLPVGQYVLANSFVSLYNQANGFTTALKNGSPQAQSYTQALKAVMGNATALNTALMVTGENSAGAQANIRAVAGASTEAGNNVKGWAAIQGTLNQKLDEAKAGFESIAIEVGEKLLPIVSKIASGFADVVKWMSQHSAVAKTLAVIIGGALVYALAAGAVAVYGFIAALDVAEMNPIVLVLTGIALAAFEIIDHWSSIAGFFSGLWHDVTSAFDAAIDAIGDAIDFVTGLPGDIIHALGSLASDLGSLAVRAWHAFTSGLESAWHATLTFLANLPYEFGYALGFLAGMLVRVAIDGWDAFTHGLAVAWNDTVAFFVALPGEIGAFFAAAPGWLLHAGQVVLTGLLNGIVTGYRAVASWLENLPREILSLLASAGTWLVNTGRTILSGLLHGIETGAVDVWNWLIGLPRQLLRYLGDAGSWLLGVGEAVIHGLLSGIEHAMSSLWNSIKSIGSGIVSGFKSALGISSPSKVMAEEIGKYIPQGIAQGMNDNMHHVTNSAMATRSAMLAALRGSAGIGLSIAGSASGAAGGGSLVNMGGTPVVVQVSGSVVDTQGLFKAVQVGTLRYRNANNQNGLASTFRRPGG